MVFGVCPVTRLWHKSLEGALRLTAPIGADGSDERHYRLAHVQIAEIQRIRRGLDNREYAVN
jgi:hypothetical protein